MFGWTPSPPFARSQGSPAVHWDQQNRQKCDVLALCRSRWSLRFQRVFERDVFPAIDTLPIAALTPPKLLGVRAAGAVKASFSGREPYIGNCVTSPATDDGPVRPLPLSF